MAARFRIWRRPRWRKRIKRSRKRRYRGQPWRRRRWKQRRRRRRIQRWRRRQRRRRGVSGDLVAASERSSPPVASALKHRQASPTQASFRSIVVVVLGDSGGLRHRPQLHRPLHSASSAAFAAVVIVAASAASAIAISLVAASPVALVLAVVNVVEANPSRRCRGDAVGMDR